MKIACVGDVGVDRYMPENKLLPGGITGNFTRQARNCFNQSDIIHLISTIGDDDEAIVALDAVTHPGITHHITQINGQTPVQYIEIEKSGEKNFTKYEPGALKEFSLNDRQKNIISSADLIMTPVYWQIYNVFEHVMTVKTKGTVAVDFSDFSTDPNFELIEKYVDKIDIGFFGLSKNQTELIDKITDLTIKHNVLAIITLGPDGSLGIDHGNSFFMPAKPVDEVVDTTGAGDAFAAGFLSNYMKNFHMPDALEQGALTAARTIQHLGSVPE